MVNGPGFDDWATPLVPVVFPEGRDAKSFVPAITQGGVGGIGEICGAL